ncbi:MULTISPECIES: hypothetical protein [Sorangium]|uniref:Uncharacterized protein n=1 Tax=Sorangium cellulosum TaxID=56 RepID=A0A4P2QS15_SORCE|nr:MULTISPECIES: hypothetical protein [Sorangium]AUX33049.1 uncharacterized protein SOCE836_052010 [Sorangium cellulosum]WCQ92424.1 hypothetical protein NQZ70_05165 [Sorangium sp. Soce836]
MVAKAGEGEYRYYTILPGGDDGPLLPNRHYLGVDAVAWFLNREDGWFSKWTASGTLEISLVGGLERYQAALGAFELQGSARTAPVFDRPVLPDRNYRGGPITLCVSLFALRRDTALAGLLKGAASASLGIVAGMVETASLAGPQLVLGAAGASLVGGVSQLLTSAPGGAEHLLCQGGLEVTLSPEQVRGPMTYVLFHRGIPLDPARLAVGASGALTYPLHDGRELADGAWILVRLRRSARYAGARGWFDRERALRAAAPPGPARATTRAALPAPGRILHPRVREPWTRADPGSRRRPRLHSRLRERTNELRTALRVHGDVGEPSGQVKRREEDRRQGRAEAQTDAPRASSTEAISASRTSPSAVRASIRASSAASSARRAGPSACGARGPAG